MRGGLNYLIVPCRAGNGKDSQNMNNEDKSTNISTNGGIGFLGALTILFIALKLTHIIDWSWWWVLAPLWIPVVVVLGIIAIVAIIVLIIKAIKR